MLNLGSADATLESNQRCVLGAQTGNVCCRNKMFPKSMNQKLFCFSQKRNVSATNVSCTDNIWATLVRETVFLQQCSLVCGDFQLYIGFWYKRKTRIIGKMQHSRFHCSVKKCDETYFVKRKAHAKVGVLLGLYSTEDNLL